MVEKGLTWKGNKIKMRFTLLFILCSCFYTASSQIVESGIADSSYERIYPTVLIATPVRNKAHTLPWFFGQLEQLHYPKDRLAIWIHSDYNSDDSIKMIQKWINATEHLYNSVEFTFNDKTQGHEGEKGPCDWTDGRFKHMIKLREEALNKARVLWADYLFMLDADVMLMNPDTLKVLVAQRKPIIAPMLNASVGDTYSNFWGGMNENGYYTRVPEYFKIVGREVKGVYTVPMVHTAFLVDMQHIQADKLSYLPPDDHSMPLDDIILFAQSAKKVGMSMHVINMDFYGYLMVPLDDYHTLDIEREQFMYLYVEALDLANPLMGPGVDYIIKDRGLLKTPHINTSFIPKDTLGFDQVYMINLDRRPERRKRMLHVFDVLGIESVRMPAVDGKLINNSYLQQLKLNILTGFSDPSKGRLLNDTYLYKELDIQVVPGFTDPYGGRGIVSVTSLHAAIKRENLIRPMTMGEIGCFLSHYFIWKDIVEKNYESVVVFEDDLRFEPYFRAKLSNIMKTANVLTPEWDLIYLGRKRLSRKDEAYLEGTKQLVWPSYSYWTLSYLLSQRGAKKLLAQNPLQNLLPVDEYLPVMFNKHPENSWKEPFYPRDLLALSAEPLLIYPTHYLGEPNYISDTEYSELITDKGDEETEQSKHNSQEEPQGPPISDYIPSEPGLRNSDRTYDQRNKHQDEL